MLKDTISASIPTVNYKIEGVDHKGPFPMGVKEYSITGIHMKSNPSGFRAGRWVSADLRRQVRQHKDVLAGQQAKQG